MKLILSSFVIAMLTANFASGAPPEKRAIAVKPVPVGRPFDQSGKVSMHRGQPCTSQIMFDFRGTKSTATIWLAARMHESKKLTDAVKRRKHVHISGTWQRGRTHGCGYVNVTRVEIEKSFLFW
jgi:hypothetical protein